MQYYCFEDTFNGGFFYVEAESLDQCWDILDGLFGGNSCYMSYAGQYYSLEDLDPDWDIY